MKTQRPTLLPSGFNDLLPPQAWQERRLRGAVLERFRLFGYREVSPPLIEFAEALIGSQPSALGKQTFHMLDPQSQEMLGLRADMTPQIARIAASRLQDQKLPLRLCYTGTCIRVEGAGLRRSRQVLQAGCELIGPDGESALNEIIQCAVEALEAMDIPAEDIILDFSQPGLAESLMADLPAPLQVAAKRAIARKDHQALRAIDHPKIAAIREALDAKQPCVASQLQAAHPQLTITHDPLDSHGYGYYDQLAFSLFSKRLGCEIGRGGRYLAFKETPAHGFTFSLTPLLHACDWREEAVKCLISPSATPEEAKNLRKKGWQTLYATASDITLEATELGCQYILETNGLKEL